MANPWVDLADAIEGLRSAPVCARTVFVDTVGNSAVSSALSAEDQDRVYQSGRDVATTFPEFLSFTGYTTKYPTPASGEQAADPD